jgi:methionine-rich copper-binding protein CopC
LLVKSQPEDGAVLAQSPEQLVAWFSEELETHSSTLQVLDAAGRQVDNGDSGVDLNDPNHASLIVTLPASLPAGEYTAHWAVISAADGDATEGEFTFSVGQAAAAKTQAAAAQTTPGLAAAWSPIWIVAGLAALLLLGLGLTLLRQARP